MLKTDLESIQHRDQAEYDACIMQFDTIAKPLGSLGYLEDILAGIAGATGNSEIDIERKCVLVFCADNGVVSRGVTQSDADADVTTAIAHMFASDKSSVCTMAKVAGADVITVDVGMRSDVDGLLGRKISRGTGDITVGAAMSRESALRAIEVGMDLVSEKRGLGYRLFATGEAGIGNTTTSAAMASVLLDEPVEAMTGRGAGLSDEGLQRKISVIKKAIEVNVPDASDPIDVLSKLGGYDIAAMAGVFLGGALNRIPVVMDGVISAVSALVAVRLCPNVRDYIVPSHISAEPAAAPIMEELGFSPIIHAGMRLGEGTGAVALFPILDMVAAVYNSGVTYESISLEAYERF